MTPQETAALHVLFAHLESVTRLGEQIQRVMHAAVDGDNAYDLINDLLSRGGAHEVSSPVALPVRAGGQNLGHWWEITDAHDQPVAGVATEDIGVWLISLINGGNDAALDRLRDFTRTISACGGVRMSEDNRRPLELVASTDEWIDLADCYLKACELLGEDPVVESGDPTYSGDEDKDVIVTIRCDACKQFTDVTVPESSRDQWRHDGALFEYEHNCIENPQPDAQVSVIVTMLWQCAWCKHWFINTDEGCPDSEGCGDANCYRCLDEHKGVCGNCKEPTVGCYEIKVLPAWYDYENQAWVKEGKYVTCGHPKSGRDNPACDCYGKLHEGEAPAADITLKYGVAPITVPPGVHMPSRTNAPPAGGA